MLKEAIKTLSDQKETFLPKVIFFKTLCALDGFVVVLFKVLLCVYCILQGLEKCGLRAALLQRTALLELD